MPKILIVDDAAADRVRATGIASRWNDCTVLDADNGQTALATIDSQMPDIVLTDMHMPEMDGLQLVSAVKEQYPNIPVILMTAQGSEDLAAQALREGAASYVPKLRLAQDLIPTLNQVYFTLQVAQSESQLMHYMSNGQVTFELPNDPAVIRVCVSRLLDMLRCLPLGDESERLRIGIALQEALDNACYHGNLEIRATEYSDDTEFESLVQERLWSEPWTGRQISVRVAISRERAEFVIADQGSGFSVADYGDADGKSTAALEQGRGIKLMKSIMDEVEFNSAGNEVRMLRKAFVDDVDDIDEEC